MKRFLVLHLLLVCAAAAADRVTVAAAANLVHSLEALHAAFRRVAPDVTVVSSTGASGSLVAQIRQGAPFDVFLSADVDYPRALIDGGWAEPASFQIFARGRLVLWTMRPDLDPSDPVAALRSPGVKRIALAQPATAPYGRAAQATLTALGLWEAGAARRVFGESIAQTAQFVETGHADLGLVALSIVRSPRLEKRGRWAEIPRELYAGVSLDHAAVLTSRGARNEAARRYLAFLRSADARPILEQFGYQVPPVASP